MRDRLTELARGGIRAIDSFFSSLGRMIADWIRSDDVTVLVVLAVVALFLLFFFLPSRRRY